MRLFETNENEAIQQVDSPTPRDYEVQMPHLARYNDGAHNCEIKGGGHRVPPAGLPIERVLGEYSLSFLRRDVALFVSTRARDSF